MQRTGEHPPQWLLFNDFAISPMPAEEVRTLYDGQKLPVLLYYSRVREPYTLHSCRRCHTSTGPPIVAQLVARTRTD